MIERVSTRMFDLDDTGLAIIVPTHNREQGFRRLMASHQKHARTVPVHAIRHPSDDYDHPHVTMWESDAFPIGKCYRAVADRIDARSYLFIDDDHSLLPEFSVEALRKACHRHPVWSLPVRTDESERVIRDAAKCGGQLVRADVYDAAGRHGDDYLEDIELSLRLSWNGTPPKRYPMKVTVHHTGTAGGLRDHPDVPEKADAHNEVSELADRYECVERSSSSYYGFREVQRT